MTKPIRLTNEFNLEDQHAGQHGDECDPCRKILVIRPEIRNQSCGCQPLEDMCPLHAAAPALLEALEGIRDASRDSLDSPRTSLTPVGALHAILAQARDAITEARR